LNYYYFFFWFNIDYNVFFFFLSAIARDPISRGRKRVHEYIETRGQSMYIYFRLAGVRPKSYTVANRQGNNSVRSYGRVFQIGYALYNLTSIHANFLFLQAWKPLNARRITRRTSRYRNVPRTFCIGEAGIALPLDMAEHMVVHIRCIFMYENTTNQTCDVYV